MPTLRPHDVIIKSEAWAEALGMMVAVIMLMLVGGAFGHDLAVAGYLLRWQRHDMVEEAWFYHLALPMRGGER